MSAAALRVASPAASLARPVGVYTHRYIKGTVDPQCRSCSSAVQGGSTAVAAQEVLQAGGASAAQPPALCVSHLALLNVQAYQALIRRHAQSGVRHIVALSKRVDCPHATAPCASLNRTDSHLAERGTWLAPVRCRRHLASPGYQVWPCRDSSTLASSRLIAELTLTAPVSNSRLPSCSRPAQCTRPASSRPAGPDTRSRP